MLIKSFCAFAILVLCIVFCACEFNANNSQTRPKPIWNLTHTDKLKQDLLFNYDKFARPAQHFNTTTVQIGITVHHIEIDEFKSTFTVNAWIQMSWADEKLKWKSHDYGDIYAVNFAEHEIWQPDIMLYNSALASQDSHPSGTHCVVKHNGTVIWVPSVKLIALCELNLKYWPFDTQRCILKFGSWTYDGNNIDIQLSGIPLTVDEGFVSGEWDIIRSNSSRNVKVYPCCEEPYPDTEFEFVINRCSSAFKDTIIALAFVIIALTLLVFWLPPQAGEKILLNGFIALIISIFMIYFSQKVPVGTQTPLIVLFYSKSLYMVGFSMLESIAVIWISRSKHYKSLPPAIKRRITGSLGKLLCLKHQTNKDNLQQKVKTGVVNDSPAAELENKTSENVHTLGDCQSKLDIDEEWLLLANAIDRIAFILFSFVFIVLSIAYSI